MSAARLEGHGKVHRAAESGGSVCGAEPSRPDGEIVVAASVDRVTCRRCLRMLRLVGRAVERARLLGESSA